MGRGRKPKPKPPPPELPNDVVSNHLSPHLVKLDKVITVTDVAQDLASLSQLNKSWYETCKTILWPRLGELISPPPIDGKPADGFVSAPPQLAHERKVESKLRSISKPPGAHQIKQMHAHQGVPAYVPKRVYAEVIRLRHVGISETNAKNEFLVTTADLAGLAKTIKSRGKMGTANLYRIADITSMSRQHHGHEDGLEHAKRLKEAEVLRKRQVRAENVDKFTTKNFANLSKGGVAATETLLQLHPTMIDYLYRNKGRKKEMIKLGLLLDWLKEKTNCQRVASAMNSTAKPRPPNHGHDYYDRPHYFLPTKQKVTPEIPKAYLTVEQLDDVAFKQVKWWASRVKRGEKGVVVSGGDYAAEEDVEVFIEKEKVPEEFVEAVREAWQEPLTADPHASIQSAWYW